MLNVTSVLTAIVSERATEHFRSLYPRASGARLDLAVTVAHTALAAIARSDALYHNVEHTTHVTLVGLQILKAKQPVDVDFSQMRTITINEDAHGHD